MIPTKDCKHSESLPRGTAVLFLTALMASASLAQSPPAGTTASPAVMDRAVPTPVAVNPAIRASGVPEALNPQPLPLEPPDGKTLVNPAMQQPGVANALNRQPLSPVDKPGVVNALNPQPLPPIDKPGVVNALNPQPLPPESQQKNRLKRRVINHQPGQ